MERAHIYLVSPFHFRPYKNVKLKVLYLEHKDMYDGAILSKLVLCASHIELHRPFGLKLKRVKVLQACHRPIIVTLRSTFTDG